MVDESDRGYIPNYTYVADTCVAPIRIRDGNGFPFAMLGRNMAKKIKV